MEFQWVPYKGIEGSFEDDLEILMLYSSPGDGISIVDIYRYLSSIILVYSKIISITTRDSVIERANAIFSKNREFYEKTLPKAFESVYYIGLSETKELLTNFMVPEIN